MIRASPQTGNTADSDDVPDRAREYVLPLRQWKRLDA